MAEGPVNVTAALRDMRANLVEVKQIRWQDILKHKGNIKLGKTDAQGNWYGASTSDEKEIARLKKDGYKVMKEACQDCGNDPCTCDENLDPDTTNVDEGTWHIAKNMTKLKKAMKKPLHNFNLVAKHIGDDELWDDLGALKKGQDMVPAIKKAMKRLGI